MKPEVRRTIASDFDKVITIPLPYRVRAWTGLVDGEVIAVGGIAYMADGTHGVFMLADDRARSFPVTMHKTALTVLREARDLGIKRLVTIAEPGVEAAERWLERLGFEPIMVGKDRVWVRWE
jgi:RimJ/RimL family protein N-acetyltransferase